MKKNRYLALLRGINVGGNNIIKMADLKNCFELIGLSDVKTYIQSGNVIFSSTEKNAQTLNKKIVAKLFKNFNYSEPVFILSHKQLKEIITEVPTGFGTEPEKYKYDVMFTKPAHNSLEIVQQIKLKEGVDQIFPGKNVVYFSRLKTKAIQSHMSKIVSQPFYKEVTIRNWNTTTKLLALMD